MAGDADPVMRLFSRRDDVTLANPLGPPVRGWDRVDERAGAQVREGEDNRFERISEFLAQIESSVEEARDIHLILDNGSSHVSKATGGDRHAK